jgi:hypothetical protein
MARFLIEVPHDADHVECIRAAKTLLQSGSHFLTNADFGCKDGVHKAWVTIDVDTREQARNILHRSLRPKANVICLNKFSIEELDDLMEQYSKPNQST